MTLSKQRFGVLLYCYCDSVGFLNLALWGQDFFKNFYLYFFFYTVEIPAFGNQYWAVANKNITECILYTNSCKYNIECTARNCAYLQSWASVQGSMRLSGR